MQYTSNDAELVAGHLAGDRSALAAIYDRYADSLYDTAAAMTRDRHDAADLLQDVFVVAAERLGQLRDPSRLKPWLFAILRNEVYRRTGRKRRTVATDFTDPVAEMHAPHEPADEGSGVEYEELAALVRGAAAGLDARDQLVLELSVRQGLQGDDLAAALGVPAQQGYGLVHRMRQRAERSLGAYCVARAGRKECPELAAILQGWDGEFSVLVRKRVARHVDGCDTCERSRRKFAPIPLFGAAPVMAAPVELRDRVLAAAGQQQVAPAYEFAAPGGFPSLVRLGRRLALWLFLAGSLLVLLLGAGVYVLADDDAGSLATTDTTTTTAPATVGVGNDGSGAGSTTVHEGGTGQPGDPADATTTTTANPAALAVTTAPGSTTTTTVDPTTTTSLVAAAPGTPTPTSTPTTTTPTTPTTTTTATTATTTTTTTTTTTATTTTLPGSLAVSTGSIDFGTVQNSATVSLSNTGDSPVAWSALTGPLAFRGAASPYTISPSAGILAGGASVEITVTLDRTWPEEGPLPTEHVTFAAEGTSAGLDLNGEIGRPPVIRPVALPPELVCAKGARRLDWEVAILDESFPIMAAVDVTTPAGARLSDDFAQRTNWFGGVLLPDSDGNGVADLGTYGWTIRVTDALGNASTLSGKVSVGSDRTHC